MCLLTTAQTYPLFRYPGKGYYLATAPGVVLVTGTTRKVIGATL
jgi:hypothetical protein